jgi:hypothetical protein
MSVRLIAVNRKGSDARNPIETRTLTSNLFNYLNGNERALQLVRVPTEEQARWQSRRHNQLVEERKRLGAQGNALLLSRGFGSWENWWRPKAFSRLSQLVPWWLLELLDCGLLQQSAQDPVSGRDGTQ